jgi:hypothetical protein
LQLCGQPTVLTAADAAAKAASAPEVRPQAIIPGPKAGGTFDEVKFPGAFGTALEAINPRGDIVGVYQDDGNFNNFHNFLLSKGTFTNIDPPGGQGPALLFLATQMGINTQGDIVGNYRDSNFQSHGFLLSKGIYTSIDAPWADPSNFGTWASGINPRGDIVGFYFDSSGNPHGFLLSNGIYTNIDVPEKLGASPGSTQASAMNPQGDILGEYWDNGHNEHGFLLSRKGIFHTFDVPGSNNTFPLGMNPQGDIVGTSFDTPAFLLTDGAVTAIDVPGSSFTVPYGISPRGDIVGLYFDSANNLHGFLRMP